MCMGMLVSALAAGCGGPKRLALDPRETPSWTAEDVSEEGRAAARAAYAKAVFLRERGEFEAALELHLEAVQLAPGDPTLRLGLANLQVETGRVREALAFLKTSVQRFGGSAEEYHLLARLQILGKRPDLALSACDSALARDADLDEAWFLRGRILMDSRRFEAALDSFRHADALAPDDAATWEALGVCLDRLKRRDEAAEAYRRALALDPEQQTSRRALAEIYRQLGRTQDAIDLFLEGETESESMQDLERAVEIYLRDGDLAAAEALLEPLHANGELPPRLTYIYGRVLLQLDQLAAADSVLAPLLEVEGVRGIHLLLGDIAARRDRSDEALEHYRAARMEDPENCTAHTSYVLLELQARRRERSEIETGVDGGDFDQALTAAEKYTGDTDFRCQVVLGHVYSILKRHTDAARHLERAHALDPKNLEILFSLAMAHQESGSFEEALRHSRAVLTLDPENAPALNFVGYILAERGQDLAESESLIRRALEKEPQNGYYVDSLGWVLFQKGDYAGAVVELEHAVALTEERDAIILEHLGDAYVKTGQLDAAYRAYGKSKHITPTNATLSAKLAKVAATLGKP